MERSLSSMNGGMNGGDDYGRIVYELPDGTKLGSAEWMYSIPELLFIDYHKEFEYDLMDEWIDKMEAMDAMNKQEEMKWIKYQNMRKVWKEDDFERFRFKGLASILVESLNECDVDIR